MVDTGHYAQPYFAGRGYRVAPVVLAPGATNPAHDEEGHGTGESANIFAIIPDAELLPVKWNFVNSVAAIKAAVALNPDILTCSWTAGSKKYGPLSAADQAAAAAVAAAWASGIVVIFAAGNGHWVFPAQHPDCIATGGVFMAADGSLRASDYASGSGPTYYSRNLIGNNIE